MTTFISYSRVNSDFAVSIAKDLKNAGFDIWLDQIDIPTGSRWDDEIEKALETSDTFLIVLSPESIQSQNVKDEIGYAIDAGKQILPVVIKNCKVPFRLRRFQYVDFSAESYEQSLVKIKYLLGHQRDLLSVQNNTNEEGKKEALLSSNIFAANEKPATGTGSVSVETFIAMKSERKWKTSVLITIACVVVISITLLLRTRLVATEAIPVSEVEVTALTQASTFISPSETPTSQLSTPTPFPEEIIDANGISMRLVLASEFTMGNENGSPDERPTHKVYLGTYYIDKYEVTNAAYKRCVDIGKCDPPKQVNSYTRDSYYGNSQFDNYPVIYVDWSMAKNYCEWRGTSLPTEAQWEKAARGIDGRTYPWGEDINCDKLNYDGCNGDTTIVGGYLDGVSPYGLYDMAGNVWEWMEDWYSEPYYLNSPSEDPLGPESGQSRVLRGGAWGSGENLMRASLRGSYAPDSPNVDIGFRCARSVP